MNEPILDPNVLRKLQESNELVQEVAEDMEDVLNHLRTISQRQTALEAQVEQLRQQVYTNTQIEAKELSKIRKELTDSQDSVMGVSLFNTVIATLDSLYIMINNMDKVTDARVYTQTNAIILMIESMFQGLQIQGFQPSTGDDFDPQRMRCEGFEESTGKGVVRTVKRGYHIRNRVLREAAVILSQEEINQSKGE